MLPRKIIPTLKSFLLSESGSISKNSILKIGLISAFALATVKNVSAGQSSHCSQNPSSDHLSAGEVSRTIYNHGSASGHMSDGCFLCGHCDSSHISCCPAAHGSSSGAHGSVNAYHNNGLSLTPANPTNEVTVTHTHNVTESNTGQLVDHGSVAAPTPVHANDNSVCANKCG